MAFRLMKGIDPFSSFWVHLTHCLKSFDEVPLEENLTPVVFEKQPVVGGLWTEHGKVGDSFA